MEMITADGWLARQELTGQYSLPVKVAAQWATKGSGPPYAESGRRVRYLLSDVIDWEESNSTSQSATGRDCRAAYVITGGGSMSDRLTLREASEYLNIPVNTLRWYRNCGTGPRS